jgi:hypothetical protein
MNFVSGNENTNRNRRFRRFVFREGKSAVFKARGTIIFDILSIEFYLENLVVNRLDKSARQLPVTSIAAPMIR